MLLAFLLLTNSNSVTATPLLEEISEAYAYLLDRTYCAGTSCGWDGSLCCPSGEACYTDSADQAQCGAAATTTAATGWQYYTYTTVYTQTDLVTRTSTAVWSSYVGGATATTTSPAVVTPVCDTSEGESSCGDICCASDQYCYSTDPSGQCKAYSGASASYASSYSKYLTTTTYSAPVKPTSGTAKTTTTTVSKSTTVAFLTPVGTAGAVYTGITAHSVKHGLSGGAIAGIIIGVIAAVILLTLLCLYCCARHIFFMIFGRKDKRRERVEVIEERRTRYGSAASTAARRDTHGGWWTGGRPKPVAVRETREKKSSGLGGLGAVGAGLAGLALVLGLKRKADRPEKASTVSDYSYDYDSSYLGTDSKDFHPTLLKHFILTESRHKFWRSNSND
jgi:hypothetical protein